MNWGMVFALLGAAIATAFAGIGSIKGVGMVDGGRDGGAVGGFLQIW